ncbi:ABC transporter substrate-binding protein [Herbiconiux sp. 11R-BC]|uniref:ABC transporter substrate-binding protein n=1 Tax=Herbiconiux sp. 11R-BC TaxID=3111637 RepID=UPI003C0254C6
MTSLRPAAAFALGLSALVLAGCASPSTDPLAAPSASSDAIVVGSQAYYSNEIVAEIYSQALEKAGLPVERAFNIGQREAYVPSLEAGEIDLFPEYTGPLLQFWDPSTTLTKSDEVYDALVKAAPAGLRVLDQSPATDQDSYVVTKEFSEKYGVTSIADLASVPVPLVLAGNSEGATRPNGPKGLLEHYGVTVSFTPIEDGGGPLTIQALDDGAVQLAIVYTASPAIKTDDLVVLDDPQGLFTASHLVPIASDRLPDEAVDIVNAISAALTPDDLVALNVRSVDEQLGSAQIASDWLAQHPVD